MKKTINICVFLLIIAGLTFTTCLDDAETYKKGDDGEMTTEMAKSVFESTIREFVFRKDWKIATKSSEVTPVVYPLWEYGITYRQSDGRILTEVPLNMPYGSIFLENDTTELAGFRQTYKRIARKYDQDPNPPRNTAYKLLAEQSVDGQITFRIAHITFRLLYIQRLGPGFFQYNMSDMSDFCGSIRYYDLSGNFIRGNHYSEGQVTGSIYPVGSSDSRGLKSSGQTVVRNVYSVMLYSPNGNMLKSSEGWWNGGGGSGGGGSDYKDPFEETPGSGGGGSGGSNNNNNQNATYTINLQVSDGGQLTLGRDYTMTTTITPNNGATAPASVTVQYRIAMRGDTDNGMDYALDPLNPATGNNIGAAVAFRPYRAGEQEVSVFVIINGKGYTSDIIPVTIQNPLYSEIRDNATVQAKMNSLFNTTKTSYREKGCWIYLNTETNTYLFDDMADSEMFNCQDSVSVTFTYNFRLRESCSPNCSGVYIVANFHTHPPAAKCPSNGSRPVGPSSGDKGQGTTSLVYDYIGFEGRLYGGHNINAPAMVYNCGPDRMPINFNHSK